MIDVIHRSHNGSKRCQEECRSNCPSMWGVSAAQLLVQGVLAPARIDACRQFVQIPSTENSGRAYIVCMHV